MTHRSNMNRRTILFLHILAIVAMAAATMAEKHLGSSFAHSRIYGSWWFALIWALLAAAVAVCVAKGAMHRPAVAALHISFIVILAGALATRCFGVKGVMHLRTGIPSDTFTMIKADRSTEERKLPFTVELVRFGVEYYGGTDTASNYMSELSITSGGQTSRISVSVNKIGKYHNTRFYQQSFDSDHQGSVISINSDPVGIAITYTGYLLMFVSMVWMLADKRGTYRRLASAAKAAGAVAAPTAILLLAAMPAKAARTLPAAEAERLGRLYILYNGRVCPLQTFALDFTKKVYGNSTYQGLSAEQVASGWMFFFDEWKNEPFIKIKGREVRNRMLYTEYKPYASFFNTDMGGYTIGPFVKEYADGSDDSFHRQIADIDEKIQLIMQLRLGRALRLFPIHANGYTCWMAPGMKLPEQAERANALYIQNIMPMMAECAAAGNYKDFGKLLDSLDRYQKKNGTQALPGSAALKAELIYNKIPFASLLFVFNLTAGTILLFFRRRAAAASLCLMASVAVLTACISLRWAISGHAPMAGGYDTTLLMAWLIMLSAMPLRRAFPQAAPLGLVMSGLCLLVTHHNIMNPQITHRMPVLNSPLLAVHVSVIMMAYAMLALTFACGVAALTISAASKTRRLPAPRAEKGMRSLQLLSRLCLYPALACLAAGIFIGAVWANVSWGQYWGWDPKEVWALITLMLYGIAAHSASLPALRKPTAYHLFMTLAFAAVAMTYFGVNYYLGGAHSYGAS